MEFTRWERGILTVISVLGLGVFWLILCAGFFVEFGLPQGVAVLLFALIMLATIGVADECG